MLMGRRDHVHEVVNGKPSHRGPTECRMCWTQPSLVSYRSTTRRFGTLMLATCPGHHRLSSGQYTCSHLFWSPALQAGSNSSLTLVFQDGAGRHRQRRDKLCNRRGAGAMPVNNTQQRT